jgi:hypothetical protein
MVELAAGDHAADQRQGFRGDRKLGKTRGKARQAKNAHRVFGESRADMTQDARSEVVDAAIGVDQRTVGSARDGVDGQVAARQILAQGDLGGSMKGKALVAVTGLALGARQRIFCMRMRVQEDREILAHRLETACQHLLGGGTDDHVIAILDR